LFLLKKLAGGLVSPLSLILLAAAAGLALLWFSRRQRTGKWLVTAAFLLLVAGAYGWLGGPALRALEHSYQPLAAMPRDVKWVVVLGGGTASDPSLPLVQRMTPATLARLVEGVRLQRQAPGAKLVLSGAAVFGSGSDAQSMSAMAAALGVPADALVADARSADTQSQARNVRAVVKDERVALVTSAVHMRRALLLFRRAGVQAIPAPTDYLSASSEGFGPADFFPDAEELRRAESATHEYLGIAWARLSGAW
jgi:uncharacterized SAM-binding protein YcdF (DUF218 family)